MQGLTKKQHETMEFILKFVREQGRTPTMREVQAAFGLRAVSSALQRVNALRNKGFLRHGERHITLPQEGQAPPVAEAVPTHG